MYLERLTKPGDGVDADERTAKGTERFVDVLAALVSDGEAAELAQPGEGAFDHPAMAPKPFAGVDPCAGDPHLDSASPQEATTARDVVGLVGMELGGALPWATAWALDVRNGVDHCLEDRTVVAIGSSHEGRACRAPSV
jgi:hypothetical protein